MKLHLPFAFEAAYRVHRGRKRYREIYQSQVEVELKEADKAAVEKVMHIANDRRDRAVFADSGGLIRPLLDKETYQAIRAHDFHAYATGEFRDRPTKWDREDFPRPRYSRCASYLDRHALDWPDEAHMPKRFRNYDSNRESARCEAKAVYERSFQIIDGDIWTRTPEPVWVLRPFRTGTWQLAVELNPSIWEAAMSFSITNDDKAEWFADELSLEVDNWHHAEGSKAFQSSRSDLTALASNTIALARSQLLPPVPDEQVSGKDSLALVEMALLAAGGSSEFPWQHQVPREFADGVNTMYLRSRWRFELERAEHVPFKNAIWPTNAAMREAASAVIAARPLAHIDLEHLAAEAELAFLGP